MWSLRAILVVEEAVEEDSPPSPGQVMIIRIRFKIKKIRIENEDR